jgi:hypothetical protein
MKEMVEASPRFKAKIAGILFQFQFLPSHVMAERCESMAPGERERFRQRMRKRFGFGPSNSETKGAMKSP